MRAIERAHGFVSLLAPVSISLINLASCVALMRHHCQKSHHEFPGDSLLVGAVHREPFSAVIAC